MTQKRGGIHIDQDHYIQALKVPDMEVAKEQKLDKILSSEGQTKF